MQNKGYYDWRTRRFIPNKPKRSEINAYLDMLGEIAKVNVSKWGKKEEFKAEPDGQLLLFG